MAKKNPNAKHYEALNRLGYLCAVDGIPKTAEPGELFAPQQVDVPRWLDEGKISDPETHTGEKATLTKEGAAELARTKGVIADLKVQEEVAEENLKTLHAKEKTIRTEVDRQKQELAEVKQNTAAERDKAKEERQKAKDLRAQAQADFDAAEELDKKTKALKEKQPPAEEKGGTDGGGDNGGGGSDGGGGGGGAGTGGAGGGTGRGGAGGGTGRSGGRSGGRGGASQIS